MTPTTKRHGPPRPRVPLRGDQIDLFAPPPVPETEPGLAEKREGMTRVEEHANDDFKVIGAQLLRDLARQKGSVTSNDLWELLDQRGITTHDNRAMGALFLRAAREGLLVKTSETVPSTRKSRHAGDVRVWRSLVCGGAA